MYVNWLKQKEFINFDGLRAISITAVIIYHAAPRFSVENPYTQSGFIGVDLFFVISGFLITTLLIREKNNNGRINLRYFYARRALRIFPLYFSLLFFHLFLALFVINTRYPVEAKIFISNFWYFFTYTSNWFVGAELDRRTIFAFAWSLATEEQFYMVWPSVLFIFMSTTWPLIIAILLLVGTTALQMFPQYATPIFSPLILTICTSISPAICLGVILSILLHSRIGAYVYNIISVKHLSNITLVLFILSYILFSHGLITKLLLVFIMSFMVATLSTNKEHIITPILTNWIIKCCGRVSYGMYMYHMLVLNAIIMLAFWLKFQSYGWFCISLVLLSTFITAYISFNYFEKIFMDIKKKYSIQVS